MLEHTKVICLEDGIHVYIPFWSSLQERDKIFTGKDGDSQGTLNAKEIQRVNAVLYNRFPRLGLHGDKDELGGFPPVLFKMTSLRHLDLSYQALRRIPEQIKDLTNLNALSLTNNPQLHSISGEVGILPLKGKIIE